MRMGVPDSSLNCFEGWGFFVFASLALGMGAMRVPKPAAGIITITFIAGCKYTSGRQGVQIRTIQPGEGAQKRRNGKFFPGSGPAGPSNFWSYFGKANFVSSLATQSGWHVD